MSVKIAAFKKLPPGYEYACSVLEVQEWAKEFADLRIEFGTHKTFQLSPRCNNRPQIQGDVVVSVSIDSQLKPSIFLYPILASHYSKQAQKEFLEGILPELKKWLSGHWVEHNIEIIGKEMVVYELNGGLYKMHKLRYL
jgi:hypothetical protein